MLKKIQCFIEGMMSVVSRGNSLETERYNTPGMHLTLFAGCMVIILA